MPSSRQVRRVQEGDETGADLDESGERQERQGEDRQHVARDLRGLLRLKRLRTGTRAGLSPPSPVMRRTRFGEAEAARNASATGPAQRLREQHVPGEAEDPRQGGAEPDEEEERMKRHGVRRLAGPGTIV